MSCNFKDQMNKEQELAAMWFDKAILIIRDNSFVKANRVVCGDRLLFDGRAFVSCSDERMPNVEIVGCYGNAANSILFFMVRDLITNMIMKVDLILTK